jgi:hypothetical protein
MRCHAEREAVYPNALAIRRRIYCSMSEWETFFRIDPAALMAVEET